MRRLQRVALVVLMCYWIALPGTEEVRAHEGPAQAKSRKPIEKVRRAFSLVRHDGQQVTDMDFHGKNLLIFFGFTDCPDVCPTHLVTISHAATQLDRIGIKITPVFITVDPETDTPELLAPYVQAFHPRMVGLTGTRQNISNVAAAYGVEFGVQKSSKAYYVWHSSYIYFVGPTGKLLETFPPYVATNNIVAGVKVLLSKSK